MEKIKRCSQCGYSSESIKDIVCPICGGKMIYKSRKACDEEMEKDWNNGYHDDFMEKRKTGSYCDKKLEKYTNGGEHYHNEIELPEDEDENEYSTKTIKVNKFGVLIIGIFTGLVSNFLSVPIAIIAIYLLKKMSKTSFSEKEEKEKTKGFIAGVFIGAFLFFSVLVKMV